MQVLFIACYELGHQPLSLAWPAAVLRRAGFSVTTVDLSVEALPRERVQAADFVGISVPMHTAMRLGVRTAEQVRLLNPRAHICCFGLYAWLNADFLLNDRVDSVIAGEAEEPLLALVRHLAVATNGSKYSGEGFPDGVSSRSRRVQPFLVRGALPPPDRADLAGLSEYARYVENGHRYLAGYVEASRGCLHTCRHCPVVPVYRGRFFIVPVDTVLADVRQQVEAGAEHVTFGDPDFLNGPGHVLKIMRMIHSEFPRLTFDFTTKVEHILQHRTMIAELRELGASFVVSAFESVNDTILARLEKGHTRADMEEALRILDAAGLPVQPTWLPFTPWTTLDDYLKLLDWIRAHRLVANVPAVQLAIRLLVPPGSALLDDPSASLWVGELDESNFIYTWRNPDPRVDELQQNVAAAAEGGGEPYEVFARIERLAYSTAGRRPPERPTASFYTSPPRLTEDWFCCAEPTTLQLDRLAVSEAAPCCAEGSGKTI